MLNDWQTNTMISKRKPTRGTMFLLGVRVDNTDRQTALEIVRTFIVNRNGAPPRKIFFTNVHTIHLARRDSELRRIVNQADVVLPDGSGLKIAGKLLNKPIIENLNGTDFTPSVLSEANANGWSVYLLGGYVHVIEGCRLRLHELFPALKIVGSHQGHFSLDEEDALIEEINGMKPDILLVALGSPAQEKWIARNANRLNVGLCFGVGGLFDFISGERKRAPGWMRSFGIEWAFRFLQDPKAKWNRVFVEIPMFLALVVAKRLIPRRVRDVIARSRIV